MSLCGGTDTTNNIIGRLENVEAFHLKAFADKTAQYWHDNLVDKFSKYTFFFKYIFFINCYIFSEFENILKNIKWPNLGLANDGFNPSKDACNKIAILSEYLFMVQRFLIFFKFC